ncbi:alcohol dehydrogenase catalytic domain-containing protein [Enterococcus sp. BWT-B8]|uniref:zinc-dependent alcohol dehydrogenase n=1 Tax=unclassified Enterococcus TaxID=2608891 RepID=UPI001E5AADD3|nr:MULTISPECIES: alcohol dehydrogenase catalytic domain-containing protein [unclassified Enterococcus]MCB5952819.1 alcohol dehydrogenase catalytic domain-containing protein [Enterococcus sp. BWT-B8]MCB5953824.1 alcohol dehydrogenase catalytic domain-containing protein [Enterococcus sp. CWB-B31]
MRTAVFHGIKDLVIEECDIPKVSADKILIKIKACAICTWEQRVYTGVKKVDYPFIGGHEIAAEIIDLGSNIDSKNWTIGDKVVFGTNLACGNCEFCKSGEEQNCLDFNHSKHLEGLPHKGMGGLSEYMLVEPRHLFHYSNVSPEEAALTEPLSCVVHSCETADIQYGDLVVVIGCGIMGQLHIALAVKSGAAVLACDLNPDRLVLAKKLGAHYTVNSDELDLADEINRISRGLGANVVFDTTPIPSVVEEAVSFVANTGRVILYSSFYPDTPVPFSPDKLHKGGYQIAGTANSNSRDFVRAAKMISEKIIDVRPFISEVVGFDEVVSGFESAIKGDKYRVVVKF